MDRNQCTIQIVITSYPYCVPLEEPSKLTKSNTALDAISKMTKFLFISRQTVSGSLCLKFMPKLELNGCEETTRPSQELAPRCRWDCNAMVEVKRYLEKRAQSWTKWSRAKTNRVSPGKRTGVIKHPLSTIQNNMDITRWSMPWWLYFADKIGNIRS